MKTYFVLKRLFYTKMLKDVITSNDIFNFFFVSCVLFGLSAERADL